MAAGSSKTEAVTINVQNATTQVDNSIEELKPSSASSFDKSVVDSLVSSLLPLTPETYKSEDVVEDTVVGPYRPLYDAVLENNWKRAKAFLKTHPDGLTAAISLPNMRTALSVAAMEGHSDIVEKLVELMPKESLAKRDLSDWTAVNYAAIDGNFKSVRAILKKDPTLAQSVYKKRCILVGALIFSDGQETMPNKKKPKIKKVSWLLSVLTKEEHVDWFLLASLLGAGYFDICLYLLNRYPKLLSNFNDIKELIVGLITLWSQFRSGSRMGFWEAYIYNLVPIYTRNTPRYWLKEEVEKIIPNSESLLKIQSNSSSRIGVISQVIYWIRRLIWRFSVFLVPSLKYIRYKKKQHMYAVKLIEYLLKQIAQRKCTESEIKLLEEKIEFASVVGSVEIIKAFYKLFPDMIWSRAPIVVKNAIEQRHDQIFSLFNDINGRNKLLFMQIALESKISHSAAKLSPDHKLLSVSGAAFQIQRELQWFEEVNKLMAPFKRNIKEKETSAWEDFMKEHKDLRKEAEQWMKDTSNYCMVVAALIATVAFAAAFTVPGGNNGDNGVPIYIKKKSFLVFAIFNALALFSSITSMVMFLSILTSRFAMEDFMRLLPKRVIMGLSSLFFCFASMLVAFGAGLSIVLNDRWGWFYIPILASFPGLMFVILQLPLFINMIQSTYGRGVFHPKKIW